MTNKNEFHIISNYLLGVSPAESLSVHYEKAIRLKNCKLSKDEEKVWNRMLKNKFLFGLYDSGLSSRKPHSTIRKRILVALAILETSPLYTSYFLNEKPLFIDFLKVIIRVPYAIIQGIIGRFLISSKL